MSMQVSGITSCGCISGLLSYVQKQRIYGFSASQGDISLYPSERSKGWAVMGRYIFVSVRIKLLVNKKAAVFGGNSSVFKTALTCKLLKHLRKLFIKLFAAVGLMKLHCAVKQFTFIYLQ